MKREGAVCMTGMSETIFSKTEPVSNESRSFQNISMALVNLKNELSEKKCDRLTRSIFVH